MGKRMTREEGLFWTAGSLSVDKIDAVALNISMCVLLRGRWGLYFLVPPPKVFLLVFAQN